MVKGLVATGGSTTSVIDTTISDEYQDDDFKDYTAFVHRDYGGAGAAPQNEFQRVSAYTASSKTLTTGTFTAAIAAGDEILLAKPNPFPLADVKRLCNTAIRSLGRITQFNTSLTTAADTENYTLPDVIRIMPSRIWVQDGSGYYSELSNWRVEEGAEGADWTLVISESLTAGYTLKIEFNDIHSMMSLYNDPVSESIPHSLAVAVCAFYCAKWQATSDDKWMPRAADLRQLYEAERIRNPMAVKNSKVQGMPHW